MFQPRTRTVGVLTLDGELQVQLQPTIVIKVKQLDPFPIQVCDGYWELAMQGGKPFMVRQRSAQTAVRMSQLTDKVSYSNIRKMEKSELWSIVYVGGGPYGSAVSVKDGRVTIDSGYRVDPQTPHLRPVKKYAQIEVKKKILKHGLFHYEFSNGEKQVTPHSIHSPSRIRVGVKCAFFVKGEVGHDFYLFKDANKPWDLMGGGIEWGESPLEALQRELREETGMVFESRALLLGVTTAVDTMWEYYSYVYIVPIDNLKFDSRWARASYLLAHQDVSDCTIQPWVRRHIAFVQKNSPDMTKKWVGGIPDAAIPLVYEGKKKSFRSERYNEVPTHIIVSKTETDYVLRSIVPVIKGEPELLLVVSKSAIANGGDNEWAVLGAKLPFVTIKGEMGECTFSIELC